MYLAFSVATSFNALSLYFPKLKAEFKSYSFIITLLEFLPTRI